MTYIQLKQGKYLLKTSIGPKVITPTSFNYNKILRLVDSDTEESKILTLLETPDVSNGIYEAYLHETTNKLLYTYWSGNKSDKETRWATEDTDFASNYLSESKYLGVYNSLESIQEDWPEYFI